MNQGAFQSFLRIDGWVEFAWADLDGRSVIDRNRAKAVGGNQGKWGTGVLSGGLFGGKCSQGGV